MEIYSKNVTLRSRSSNVNIDAQGNTPLQHRTIYKIGSKLTAQLYHHGTLEKDFVLEAVCRLKILVYCVANFSSRTAR